ncbi:MAG TPA: hypothetical protein VFQ44_09545 [Streptosporangiaceae bacterium]|nr:hypothetical protein [Streptosporangiaceae bacterium]
MDIASLVALAGNTLVAVAVTDAWETARHKVARLFGCGLPDPATVRRLDATRSRLAAAGPAERSQVQVELAGQWATRLADLIGDHPEAETGLRVLVNEIRGLLPAGRVAAGGYSVAAGGDVSIKADRSGVAAGVIHGDIAPPGPTGPGPATG